MEQPKTEQEIFDEEYLPRFENPMNFDLSHLIETQAFKRYYAYYRVDFFEDRLKESIQKTTFVKIIFLKPIEFLTRILNKWNKK